MKGKAILKVEKGKLIKMFLDYNGKINGIKITGDFFVHPEEGIEMLEKELLGTEIDKKILLVKISNFFKEKKIELFGIDPESLVTAIMNCTEGEK